MPVVRASAFAEGPGNLVTEGFSNWESALRSSVGISMSTGLPGRSLSSPINARSSANIVASPRQALLRVCSSNRAAVAI